jgi:hypothetical protein
MEKAIYQSEDFTSLKKFSDIEISAQTGLIKKRIQIVESGLYVRHLFL